MPKSLNDEFDIMLPPGSRRISKPVEEIAGEMESLRQEPIPTRSSRRSNAPAEETPRPNALRNDNILTDDQDKSEQSGNDRIANEGDTASRRPRRRISDPEPPGIIKFFTDRRLHIFFALLCIIVGCVMTVILVSHLRSGGNDQSRAANLPVEQIASDPHQVENAGGALGAKLSQSLFTEALGLGSLVLALYFITLGVTIIRRKRLQFWSKTFKALLLTVALSIVPGLVCYTLDTEINWGGTHGHWVNETLMRLGGPMIAVAVSCILIGAIVCVYLNDLIRLYRIWREKKRALKVSMPTIHKTKSESHPLDEKPVVEPDEGSMDAEPDDFPADALRPATVTYPRADSEFGSEPEDEPFAREKDEVLTGFTIDEPSETDRDEATDANDTFEVDAPEADIKDNGDSVAQQKPYDHRAELSHYRFPTLDLLHEVPTRTTVDMDEQQENKDRIIKALADHKVYISSIKATVGPTVTLFEVVPTEGTRIAQIKRLEDDIAMTLKARGIRIIAPLPGKGTVGIEVPNNDPQTVSMRYVLASTKFRESKKALPVALGATVSNDIFVTDIASMPHVLVAGATGQGKSVGLNCIIASLLYKKHPTELKFILIDPKEVEFSLYTKLCNHYLAAIPGMDEESGIITKNENVLLALNSLCVLMDKRYTLLRKAGVRNIVEYNDKFTAHKLNPENGHEFMPYIVVIIDEFADLIMTAGKEIELPVTRITQKARAVGIHMVIATQRPSTNVLTGLIKANCPTRIAFRVMQMVDSRTILDQPGANQLIGRGDMLYSSGGEVERMQCAFIDTDEVENLCEFVGEQIGFEKPYYLPEPKFTDEDVMIGTSHATAPGMDRDPLFDEAARFIISQSTASVSSLQRRYQIGYNRAGKIMDQMEAAGIVGPGAGSKPRNILVDGPTLELILENKPY